MLFIALSQGSFGQPLKKHKYWVFHSSEDSTALEQILGSASYYSSSIEAGLYELDFASVQQSKGHALINDILPVQRFATQRNKQKIALEEAFALEQLKAKVFSEAKMFGSEVNIGVIDGGFMGADADKALVHIFQSNSVQDYIDLITPSLEAYGGSKFADDRHGTEVLKMIGGKTEYIQYGLATEANYFLARTDHGSYERRIEEDFVIKAMERMDSLGVKVINISLGYTDGFDDPAENYIPAMMNGKTSALTRAVDYFVREKDILIVVAAGNDGDKDWKVVSSPADAALALTVGATGFKYWNKAKFSSIGSDEVAYIKPEVSCFSNVGTSFSAPVIAGLAACLRGRYPSRSALEIKTSIIQSAHLYPYGNNYIGYGVPDLERLLRLTEQETTFITPQIIYSEKRAKARLKHGPSVVFYKKNEWQVIEQQVIFKKKWKADSRITFDCVTVVSGEKVFEFCPK